MLFNSIPFLIFFPVVTLLYFILPHRFRWLLLLLASCFFYMFFKPVYILILAFTIIIDYFAGILIESAADAVLRKRYLLLSLVANIGVLAFFKYYNFLTDNVTGAAALMGYHTQLPYLKMLLPIGLSFHTFQAMSYTIEVYRGNHKAERHFGIYALYVMFYPQLVAGPIERPQNILYQFHEKKYFDRDRVIAGLKLMLWGFFKKIVIADRLSIYVDTVYKAPGHYHGFQVLIAVFFFAFQIYCDFSGYTDIAIGAAKVMGFDLMKNFDYPFTSRSVSEYWRRWHISLSTWFNDYLFLPILANRRNWGKMAVVFGLLATFFISGLWHGAAWTFIIWGVLHGMAISYEFLTGKFRIKMSKKIPAVIYTPLSMMLTFLFLLFSWIFFRASTIHDAFTIIKNAPINLKTTVGAFNDKLYYFLLIVGFIILENFWKNKNTLKTTFYGTNLKPVLRISYYSLLFWFIVIWGVFGNKSFIYFQF